MVFPAHCKPLPGRTLPRAALLFLFVCGGAHLQAAELEEILVTDHMPASATESLQQIEVRLSRVAGGTNLIDLRDQPRLTTLSDIFAAQPGVIVQEFFGGLDQPRLNIRGSGLQSNPVSRGVQLQQDYLPLNEADGSFIIGLLQPYATRAVTVHRGANSRAPGSVTLGGDINFLSFTGAEPGDSLQVEVGDFDRYSAHANYGGRSDNLDYHLSGGTVHSDGYRRHSESERQVAQGNVGVELASGLTNRTYVSYNDTHFDMPFVLPQQQAKDDPRSVMGDGDTVFDRLININKRDPHRDFDSVRIANRTFYETGGQQQALGLYFQDTDDHFVDPLEHMITRSQTGGVQWTMVREWRDAGTWKLGADWSSGTLPREFYVTNPDNGSRGFRFGNLDLDAENLALSLGADYLLAPNWTLTPQLQWVHASRDAQDKDGARELDQSWDFWLPKIGLNYLPNPSLRLFTNLSASREIPTFWDIAQPSVPPIAPLPGLATVNLSELDDQKALTLEVGGAGRLGDSVEWNVAVYRSETKDELLSVASASGVVSITSNYDDRTVHQGVELGLGGQIDPAGARLDWDLTWNYSDFTFDNGVFDGNQIAGAPKNVVAARIGMPLGDVTLGTRVYGQPDNNPVDHANTLDQDSFWLLGFDLGYQPSPAWKFYVTLNNVTDKTYNAAYVVRDRSEAFMPTFLPGDGRNVLAGVVWRW